MSPTIQNVARPLKAATGKLLQLFADPRHNYKVAVVSVSAAVILCSVIFLFTLAWTIVGGAFAGPKVAPPEDYAEACEYVLSNHLDEEEAGIQWIEKNTDYPVNAYIGLIGVRAQVEDSPYWSSQPEYKALVAHGKNALPNIDKQLKKLSQLESQRRHASARIALLGGNVGDPLRGNDLWSWQRALKSAREEIKEGK